MMATLTQSTPSLLVSDCVCGPLTQHTFTHVHITHTPTPCTGAVNEGNHMPYYAELCPAMLAVTYSNGIQYRSIVREREGGGGGRGEGGAGGEGEGVQGGAGGARGRGEGGARGRGGKGVQEGGGEGGARGRGGGRKGVQEGEGVYTSAWVKLQAGLARADERDSWLVVVCLVAQWDAGFDPVLK